MRISNNISGKTSKTNKKKQNEIKADEDSPEESKHSEEIEGKTGTYFLESLEKKQQSNGV